MSPSFKKPVVKVCVHKDCCGRGSERIYVRLRELCSEEADIRKTDECFHFCAEGPNVAVDGTVLHGVAERDAVLRVRNEICHPLAKKDVVGTRSLDDLDTVLEELTP